MRVALHQFAQAELEALPDQERDAMTHAIEKLEVIGVLLPFPHQSAVKGDADLRELRPRAGRSPWRAFYRQIGETLWVAAIGPEAKADPRGFKRAIRTASERLSGVNG